MESNTQVVDAGSLGRDAVALLERVRSSQQPLMITEDGRTTAVLVNAAEYERDEHERQLLRSLLRGEREIAAGLGHDLDAVLAEADAMLVDEPA